MPTCRDRSWLELHVRRDRPIFKWRVLLMNHAVQGKERVKTAVVQNGRRHTGMKARQGKATTIFCVAVK